MDNFLLAPKAGAAFLFDLAFALTAGALLARLWLPAEAVALGNRLRRTQMGCALAMLVALPAQLWLLTAAMVASAAVADVRAELVTVLTETHAGRVLIPAFGLALLLFALACGCARAVREWRVYGSMAAFALLAGARSATGHAAAQGDPSVGEAVQWMHLVSIAVWAGAIVVAGFVVLPQVTGDEALTRFGRRLSQAATWAIVVVACSGGYNAWVGLGGSLAAVPHTQWGRLLAVKSGLVLVALGLGARNRWLLGRSAVSSARDAAGLRRFMRWEAVVMVGIMAVSAVLANSAPGTGM